MLEVSECYTAVGQIGLLLVLSCCCRVKMHARQRASHHIREHNRAVGQLIEALEVSLAETAPPLEGVSRQPVWPQGRGRAEPGLVQQV